MRVVHRIVLSSFVLAMLLHDVPALAQDEAPMKAEAKARFARGLEYYKMKEYEAAIAEFEAAYGIDPRNEILFAQAQAERLSGDCASAVVLYRHFLDNNPPAIHAEAARASLEKCETALRSIPDGKETPAPEKSTAPQPPATPPEASEPEPSAPAPAVTGPPRAVERPGRPFYKDPLGDGFAIAGLVAVGVGVGLYVASSNDVDAAGNASSYSEHASLLDRAESRRTYALVGLGAGSALLVGAVVRWMWPKDRGSPSADVALELRPGSGLFAISGSF